MVFSNMLASQVIWLVSNSGVASFAQQTFQTQDQEGKKKNLPFDTVELASFIALIQV